MGHIEDEVKEMIGDRFGSVPKFASAIGLPAQTVYSALRNGLMGASTSTTMPIANALGIDPIRLAQGELSPFSGRTGTSAMVPVYGSLVAGIPIDESVAERWFPVPRELIENHPEAFLLHVKGESMNRVLPNDCYALIEPHADIEASGHLYAVTIGENRATIKRVKLLNNGIELQPESDDPTYRSYVYDYGNPETGPVTIIGRVIWYCPPTNWAFHEERP